MSRFAGHRQVVGSGAAVARRAEPGHVIGVQMRVDGLDRIQVKLAHQLQIALARSWRKIMRGSTPTLYHLRW